MFDFLMNKLSKYGISTVCTFQHMSVEIDSQHLESITLHIREQAHIHCGTYNVPQNILEILSIPLNNVRDLNNVMSHKTYILL